MHENTSSKNIEPIYNCQQKYKYVPTCQLHSLSKGRGSQSISTVRFVVTKATIQVPIQKIEVVYKILENRACE